MKKSAFFLFLFLNSFGLSAQNMVSRNVAISKIFAKTFQLGSENEFIFDAFDSVQVIQTENAHQVRLMLYVYANNLSPEMMKSLAEAGRYLIKTQSIDSQLFVSLPFMKNNIVLNGAKIIEKHHFLLFAPKNTIVTRASSTAKIN